MDTYVFYVKGATTKVFAKSSLSTLDINKLKNDGFKKYHLEIMAENKKRAIEKLNEAANENMDALKGFSGDILFSSIIFIAIPLLIYFAL
ncbi:hypothetical protein ACL2XP_13655 [Sodalis sp. RH21]|uniref:hypothetical protein n=1 Tax=unclassified Sodalis (in: enterobacteria) TaxID=2636512 RepID=UPI0039B58CE5